MLSLFFFIGIRILFAQKEQPIEPAVLEVYYTLVMQKDTVRKSNPDKDNMVLRIGQNTSQFMSYHTFYYDSIWNAPSGRKKAEELTLNAFRTRDYSQKPGVRTTHNYIYKNYPQGKSIITSKRFIICFSYEENFLPQRWEMSDSTKHILNYSCKLAICHFRGRVWHAWFTESIPYSDGPWKLSGLPGLILEAYDKNKHYHYLATAIFDKNLVQVTFYNFYEKEFIPTDRITFLRAEYAFLSGKSPDEIDLIKKAKADGINVNLMPRSPRRLLYDFQELDYK